ncbi:MAG: LPS export ABC transporter ATP-binding protein [Gemmatimonadales bacterium]
MSRPDWIGALPERDASLSLALAALVSAAEPDGSIALDRLVLGYRNPFLSAVETIPGRPRSELSGDQLRESLTRSVLPRLADGGWITDAGDVDWATVRATPGWWTSAVADRAGALSQLLSAAQEGHARFEADGAVPRGQGSVLEGIGLCKSFRQRRVVDDVSIRVEQGEIVALLGPNGAGKTVTFYCLTGIIRPDAGRVILDGEDMTSAAMYQRARRGLGYLAQEPSVFRRLTVEENVLAILEMQPISKAERLERLEQMLDELSIKHLRKSMAYSLSGGERRRLEITRALVTQPKFMLLDEPFAGVDPIAVNDIQGIVAGLRHRGLGVLITDHNVEQTLDIVDRAYILFEGKVQAAGTVPELVFDERVAQLYLGPTLTARLRARLENVS